MTVAKVDLYARADWTESEITADTASLSTGSESDPIQESQLLPFPDTEVSFDDFDDLFDSI